MSELKIGRIVYVITKTTEAIIPVIIKEKNICESLDGEKITFKVLAGEPGKPKILDLSKIDSEVFGSIEEVKEFLMTNCQNGIDRECRAAEERAQKWYGHLTNVQPPAQNRLMIPEKKTTSDDLLQELAETTYNPQQSVTDPNMLQVILEDGTVKHIRNAENYIQ